MRPALTASTLKMGLHILDELVGSLKFTILWIGVWHVNTKWSVSWRRARCIKTYRRRLANLRYGVSCKTSASPFAIHSIPSVF